MRPAAQLPNQAPTGDGAKHQAVDYVTIKAQLTAHLQSRKATESDDQTHTNNRGPAAEIKQPQHPYMYIHVYMYTAEILTKSTADMHLHVCTLLHMWECCRIYLTDTGIRM